MKKIIFVIIALLCGYCAANAQNYKVEGKTIIVEKTVKSSTDVKTDYTFKDSKDNEYPIYLRKATKGNHIGEYYAYIIKHNEETDKDTKVMVPNPSTAYELGNKLAKELKLN